jgi:hypothetical protein
MSKSLEGILAEKFKEELGEMNKKSSVEEALQKALDNTTPEYGGQPWNSKESKPKVESEWFDE